MYGRTEIDAGWPIVEELRASEEEKEIRGDCVYCHVPGAGVGG